MSVILASSHQLADVKAITHITIKEVYPLYYPKGAVDFFLSHHHEENIAKDIQAGIVFLMLDREQNAVGTVTIRNNEICRLFVLPQNQKLGYGRALLDFAERRISDQYKSCILDASLPAKAIYLKRDYIVTESHALKTPSGDFLCYDVMEKELTLFG